MLTKSDHGYVRTPRDLSRCVKALSEAAKATTREARRRAVNELGLHPEGSALHALTYMNTYLQVRDCSLHALDGGGTMKHLIFMGNYSTSVRRESAGLCHAAHNVCHKS